MRISTRALTCAVAGLLLVGCSSTEDGNPDATSDDVDDASSPTQLDSSGTALSGADPLDSIDPLDGAPPAFADVPGRMRFANFVSDGSTGVDVDVYWGARPATGELATTVSYGTVSEFLTPRRAADAFGAENEISWSFLPAGAPVADEPVGGFNMAIEADDQMLVAMAAVDPSQGGATMSISTQVIDEGDLSAAPGAGAHVYVWDSPWRRHPTTSATFGVVGSAQQCSFEEGEFAGGNVGVPTMVPAGTSELAVFDANTECATGAAPADGAVAAGSSYLLVGAMPSPDLSSRTSVLIEIGG